MKIELEPIGFVRSSVKQPQQGGWKEVVSEIVLEKEYEEGLRGLEDFSHIVVVFSMDKVKTCELTHRPQGRVDVPEVGIFACRCPARPNHLAISTVELLKMEKNVLKVKGLDALDGTPVLDIKPYTPQYDIAKSARVPEWINKLKY